MCEDIAMLQATAALFFKHTEVMMHTSPQYDITQTNCR